MKRKLLNHMRVQQPGSFTDLPRETTNKQNHTMVTDMQGISSINITFIIKNGALSLITRRNKCIGALYQHTVYQHVRSLTHNSMNKKNECNTLHIMWAPLLMRLHIIIRCVNSQNETTTKVANLPH